MQHRRYPARLRATKFLKYSCIVYHTLGQKRGAQTQSLDLPGEVKLMMASKAELHSLICILQFIDLSPETALTMLTAVAKCHTKYIGSI